MYLTWEEKRAHQIDMARERRRAKRGPIDPNGPVYKSEPPPPEVQHEYIAAVTQPRTITAELFGDPLPGRSALDRKMGRIHEPA